MKPKLISALPLLLPAVCSTIFLSAAARAQSFSLTASPASVYLAENAAAGSTVTVQPVNGFNGNVTFAISTLPQGVIAQFKPPSTASTTTLVFAAGPVAATGVSTVTITGTSGSLTASISISLAVSAATGTGGSGTPVNLSSYYDVYGIYSNGTPFTTGGLDGDGYAYSVNLLTESRIYNGVQFNFGPANALDTVSGTGQPILLPAGQFGHLILLGAAVNGGQARQIINVTYTDGTVATYVRDFSDWFIPAEYAGEHQAVVMPYRCADNGRLELNVFYLYAYPFALDGTKTVESITLPDDRNVVVLAMTLTAN
ncbi:MAG TPA: hypothetical protein VMT86_18525 [Bryobacteraceae bacterium]|nr:hypothetical protein [Bryobacteraceae bacterium]